MKFLIACGTGTVCSYIIHYRIEELLKDKEYDIEIEQCPFEKIEKHLDGVDLLILAAEIDKDFGVPTIIAYNYLGDTGVKEVDKEIMDFLKQNYNKNA